jgi:uncharacterized membrane protein
MLRGIYPARATAPFAKTYLLGTFLVTLVFNVPKNNTLASVAPTDPEGTNLWTDYLLKWTAWNHVRAAAVLAAATSLTIVLC